MSTKHNDDYLKKKTDRQTEKKEKERKKERRRKEKKRKKRKVKKKKDRGNDRSTMVGHLLLPVTNVLFSTFKYSYFPARKVCLIMQMIYKLNQSFLHQNSFTKLTS